MSNYTIIKKLSHKQVPLNILVELTRRCNCNCDFCYVECYKTNDIDDGLDNDLLLNVFKDVKELGTFHIIFTGGEPFLKKDVWSLIKNTKKLGFALSVNTNGTLLGKYDIEEVAKLFANINISLHSCIPEEHDQLTRHKGSWEKTIKVLYELKKYNANVQINTVFTKNIVDSYVGLRDLVEKEFGFVWNPDIDIVPTYTGDTKHILKYGLEKNQISDMMKKDQIITTSNYLGSQKFNKDYYNLCRAGTGTFFLDSVGDIYPCLSFKRKNRSTINGEKWLQNIKEYSVKEIWTKNIFFNYIRGLEQHQFTECVNCNFNITCFKCIADNYVNTGFLTVPSQKYCKGQKNENHYVFSSQK